MYAVNSILVCLLSVLLLPSIRAEQIDCQGTCPHKYKLNSEQCVCELLESPPSEDCDLTCQEGFAPDEDCTCAEVTCPVIRTCQLTCDSPHVLNPEHCLCVCDAQCSGDFTLDEDTCECGCNIKCYKNLILNEETCTCLPNVCGVNQKYENGKCITEKPRLCSEGQLLIEEVCVTTEKCPEGYELLDDGSCQEIGCEGGNTHCTPKKCGENKYLLQGNCTEVLVTNCDEDAFFDFHKAPCPRTCAEPVPLSTCKAPSKGPGCACIQGYLLHEGKCVHPSTCPNKPICLKDADVMMMLDNSVAIGEDNYDLMKSFVRNLVEKMTLAHGTCHRAAVVPFSYDVDEIIHFTDFKVYNKSDYVNKINNIEYKPGLTYMGEALHAARTKLLLTERGLRQDVARILVILTDGRATNGLVDPNHETELIRQMGVQVVIVKVGGQDRTERERLYQMAGEDGKIYVFGLRQYSEVAPLIERVVDFQCKDFVCPRPRLIAHECKEEFRYYDRQEFHLEDYKCVPNLVKNAEKKRCACPMPTTNATDCVEYFQVITFISYEFNKEKAICHERVTQEHSRCGCPAPKEEIGPCEGQYKAINQTSFELKESVGSGKFCQPKFEQIMERCACPDSVVELKDCIGGFQVEVTKDYIFEPTSKTCTEKKSEREIRCSCPPPQVFTKPCDKTNIEVKINVERLTSDEKCIVETYVGQEPCKLVCDDLLDVGIIVDTSSSMRADQFVLVKEFLKKLVGHMDIGEDKTLVTLIVYSSMDAVRLICDFNTFRHVEALQQRIDDLRFDSGTTSTGEALHVYRTTGLTLSHGSRITQNVRQLMFLITDGLSNGDIDPVEECRKLHLLGVQIVIVAIGPDLYTAAVEEMASEPADANIFHVQDFRYLDDSVASVADKMCDLENGVNHLSVMKLYEGYVKELVESRRGTPVNKLEGDHFKDLIKLRESDFCRVVFNLKGYLSVVGGTTASAKTSFDADLRYSLSEAMGTEVYEVRDLKLNADDLAALIAVDFNAPCNGAEKLALVFSRHLFNVTDMNGNDLEVDGDILVVSSETRKAVELMELADSDTSQLMERTLQTVKNPELGKKLEDKLKEVHQWRVNVRNLLALNEDRAIRLTYEILKADLIIIKQCRDALLTVTDLDEKEKAEREVDLLRESIVKNIDKADGLCEIGQSHYEKMKKIASAAAAATDGGAATETVDKS